VLAGKTISGDCKQEEMPSQMNTSLRKMEKWQKMTKNTQKFDIFYYTRPPEKQKLRC